MPTTFSRCAGALTLILLAMSVFTFHVTPARAQQTSAPTDGTLPPPPGDDDFPIYPSSSPATLTVGPSPGNQYTNLQAAIDAARPGDTILLEAGQTFTPAAGNSSCVTKILTAMHGSRFARRPRTRACRRKGSA